MELINVYIVTYKSEQQDTRIGAVYYNMEDAKAEAQRLDESSPWCVGAGVVIRQVDVERCINEAIDNVDED